MSIQNYDNETEQKIIVAARQVFLERGFDGARMQDISERAGINKALLHYYFRSKENLFDKIYMEAARNLFPQISEILSQNGLEFFDKIRNFIRSYIEYICENPLLPIFVLREVNAGSDKVEKIVQELIGSIKEKFIDEIKAEVVKKTIKPIDPRHFMLSLISLCVFPFPSMPLFRKQLNLTEDEYIQFLKDRIPALQDFFISAIINNDNN